MVIYHVNWPASNDPFYLANTVENDARKTYYNVTAVPQVQIDGLINGGSGGPWEQMMLGRRAVASPLTVALTGQMTSGTTGTITATITNTSGGVVAGLLQFVLIEDDIPYSGSTWSHVMRDFFPAGTAGEAISLNPSDVLVRTQPFTLAGTWVRQNMEAIVFVQNSAGTKEIYQTGRIFFELDQPELRYDALIVDDAVGSGGDGDGRLDPGESASVSFRLMNLNPMTATTVAGTISSSDPYLTISDASGSWPDVPFGAPQTNTADPFVVTVAADTPAGRLISVSLALTAAGGYTKTLTVGIPVGSPDLAIGPDAYGYYAYEDGDAAPPAPTYGWVEIDPNLGGPGTLFTLSDDQTRSMALPFSFRYYGASFTTLSISSNGFLACGTTTDNAVGNGLIPGPEGPPNMIAGFWTDLNPAAAGSGKVYTYNDATHNRFIVEFSGVEHYDPAGLGLPETFQYILYNPASVPTPTGDGEIVMQYALVSDASSCTVGIENGTETVGIQYLALGQLNAAAGGLHAGRAIKYTTVPPNSASVDDGFRPGRVLLAARPNPTRGGAQIVFDIPAAGRAALRVFDLEGALVRTLIDGPMPAGPGSVAWDGRNDRGKAVASGVYFYRLSGDGYEVNRKIVKQD
jgi:hypothetical protein